jgi:ribosomal protein L37AE/L43A
MIGTDFWKYEGEPTDDEIASRKQWDKEHYDRLAIRPTCPNCGSRNTSWLRQQFCVCFDCESSFSNHYGDVRTDAEKGEDEFWENFEQEEV